MEKQMKCSQRIFYLLKTTIYKQSLFYILYNPQLNSRSSTYINLILLKISTKYQLSV